MYTKTVTKALQKPLQTGVVGHSAVTDPNRGSPSTSLIIRTLVSGVVVILMTCNYCQQVSEELREYLPEDIVQTIVDYVHESDPTKWCWEDDDEYKWLLILAENHP